MNVTVWRMLLGLVAGIGLLYLLLVAYLWRAYRRNPDAVRMREALRLLPDLVRLISRLAADPGLPRGIRIRLLLLGLYLASPIDLIPDFIPVSGYAGDAVIVAFTLRSVTRRAGSEAIERHWPRTPEGLRLIKRLARIPTG